MPEAGEGEGKDCEDNAEQRAGGGGDDLAHDVGDAGDEAGDRSGDTASDCQYAVSAAGGEFNLIRWVLPRAVKETLVPPTDHRYTYMKEE